MKNFKKVLSMLLVLLMCFSLLTACGSSDKDDETGNVTDVQEPDGKDGDGDNQGGTTSEPTEATPTRRKYKVQ